MTPRLLIALLLTTTTSSSWVDPHSPSSAKTIKSFSPFPTSSSSSSSSDFVLVFSDEFEEENRSFVDGDDPKWTAINKNDYTNDALQYYSDSLVTTSKGNLVISTIKKDIELTVLNEKKNKKEKMVKHYQSGMLQGWNKFCFTGGIVEISARLPGDANIGGLWPAMWLLGNLARATYVGSSDNVWPWSYDKCSRKLQKEQEISACNLVNHYDLQSRTGRGAPEIDILEAMPGNEKLKHSSVGRPYYSASFQTSPGIEDGSRPSVGAPPSRPEKWYKDGLSYGDNTTLNVYFYGTHLANTKNPEKSYQADAISANHQLRATHFDVHHKYRLEWAAGKEGFLKWYLDDEFLFGITAETLKLTGSEIPTEPMYLIFNTAISKTWGFPSPCPTNCDCTCFDCAKSECQCGIPDHMCDNFPAAFLLDYVRVYQSPAIGRQKVGCSTPERPTSKFIQGHSYRYQQEGQSAPLRRVSPGGGSCRLSSECSSAPHRESESASSSSDRGGSNSSHHTEAAVTGRCQQGKCVCTEGFTGPHCLVPVAGDDIQWENNDSIWHPNVHRFHFFASMKGLFALLLVAFAGAVAYKFQHEKKRKLGHRSYDAIDDTGSM